MPMARYPSLLCTWRLVVFSEMGIAVRVRCGRGEWLSGDRCGPERGGHEAAYDSNVLLMAGV
jgi:hypothetical protein